MQLYGIARALTRQRKIDEYYWSARFARDCFMQLHKRLLLILLHKLSAAVFFCALRSLGLLLYVSTPQVIINGPEPGRCSPAIVPRGYSPLHG